MRKIIITTQFKSVVSSQKLFVACAGFTVIELIIGVAIFAVLLGLVIFNLDTARTEATLSSTVETLITDLNQQQLKAMVGDTEGRTESDTYGIAFASGMYTLFHGTYSASESSNFSINLPQTQQVTTTFPNSRISFVQGSGEIASYSASTDTITILDTQNGEQRVLEFNRYGAVVAVD